MDVVTKDDIREWLDAAPTIATHMVVITNMDDWSRKPHYITEIEGCPMDYLEDLGFEWIDGGFMPHENTYIEECYSLALDPDEQLAEVRAYHYD